MWRRLVFFVKGMMMTIDDDDDDDDDGEKNKKNGFNSKWNVYRMMSNEMN